MSCYIDEINAPLYPFGYGLSYTTYAYSPVTLSDSEMPMDGSVTASVTVTNTGSRAGDEIVQLYIHDITPLPRVRSRNSKVSAKCTWNPVHRPRSISRSPRRTSPTCSIEETGQPERKFLPNREFHLICKDI